MRSRTASPDRLRVGADEMVVLAPSEQSGGALLVYEVEMAPGGGPPAMHRHAAAELVRVQAGELTVYVDDERVVAGPGDTVVIAGGREHTIRNESEAPARGLMVLSPGTQMEAFARAAAAAPPEEVAAVAAAHGVEMTRPLPWAERSDRARNSYLRCARCRDVCEHVFVCRTSSCTATPPSPSSMARPTRRSWRVRRRCRATPRWR